MQDLATTHDGQLPKRSQIPEHSQIPELSQPLPMRHEDRIDPKGVDRLVHSHSGHLDADEDYWFRLRGHSLNPLVDAASSLLGLVVRVRQLDRMDDIERLYHQ